MNKLEYSHFIDSTIITAVDITTAVNMLSEKQSPLTEDTNKAVRSIIDYCRKYLNDILIFTACDMIIHI